MSAKLQTLSHNKLQLHILNDRTAVGKSNAYLQQYFWHNVICQCMGCDVWGSLRNSLWFGSWGHQNILPVSQISYIPMQTQVCHQPDCTLGCVLRAVYAYMNLHQSSYCTAQLQVVTLAVCSLCNHSELHKNIVQDRH